MGVTLLGDAGGVEGFGFLPGAAGEFVPEFGWPVWVHAGSLHEDEEDDAEQHGGDAGDEDLDEHVGGVLEGGDDGVAGELEDEGEEGGVEEVDGVAHAAEDCDRREGEEAAKQEAAHGGEEEKKDGEGQDGVGPGEFVAQQKSAASEARPTASQRYEDLIRSRSRTKMSATRRPVRKYWMKSRTLR